MVELQELQEAIRAWYDRLFGVVEAEAVLISKIEMFFHRTAFDYRMLIRAFAKLEECFVPEIEPAVAEAASPASAVGPEAEDAEAAVGDSLGPA